MKIPAALATISARLATKRFPELSPFWARTLSDFYASGCRQLVVRAGRRGGKSSTMARVAVAEALFGEHKIPSGDVGVVAIVSTRKEEAAERLRTVKAILDALGEPYTSSDQTIELCRRPVMFRVFVASIAGVSGFTSICAICDEVAKWRDSDSGANPASEVLASLRPTLATQPNAKLFLISSPLGMEDAHARAFDAGDDDFQRVVYAPTWVANPSLTEAGCRRLEADDRVFRREYLAEPQASRLAAFDDDAIERAFGRSLPERTRGPRVIILDPSSGRKDAWTWAVAGFTRCGGVDHVEMDSIDAQEGRFFMQVSADRIAARIGDLARANRARTVIADQREALALASVFQNRELAYVSIPWTNAAKIGAVESVRRWLRENTLVLPEHEKMRRELRAFEEKISPTGALTFAGRGEHDDYVALLLTLAMAIEAGHVAPGSYSGEPAATVFNESRFSGSNDFFADNWDPVFGDLPSRGF